MTEEQLLADHRAELASGGFDAAAPDMLAGYLALAAENERLRDLLAEARDDLSTSVDQEYPAAVCRQYPDAARRHHRDMDLCRRIDAALMEPKP